MAQKHVIILVLAFLCSFGLNVYLLTRVPETIEVVKQDKALIDSIATLTSRIETLNRKRMAMREDLENKRINELNRQRQYYETQISHVRMLSADSTLRFFTAFTDRERRYPCGSTN